MLSVSTSEKENRPPPREEVARAALLALGVLAGEARTLVAGEKTLGEIAAHLLGRVTLCDLAVDDLGSQPSGFFHNVVLVCPPVSAQGHQDVSLERLVHEAMRVLRPGGRALLVLDNPLGPVNLARCLRHPAMCSRLVRAWRTMQRIRGVLAGHRAYLVWPRLDRWRLLQPVSHGLPRIRYERPKERIEGAVVGVLRRMGKETLLAPAYVLVYEKQESGGETGSLMSLLQRVLEAEGLPDTVVALAVQPNSRSVTFSVGGTFFKVPLTPEATTGLREQLSNLQEVARLTDSRFAPIPARMNEVSGVQYATFPSLPSATRPAEVADCLDLMERLHGTPVLLPLAQSDLWRRISGSAMREMLEEVGATKVLDVIGGTAAVKLLPVSRVHGDLHPANIIPHDAERYLVDWDRFEPRSPILLDYAELFLAFPPPARSPLDALLLSLSGEVGEYRALAEFVRGDWTAAEAVSIYVLHRVSWVLRRHGLADRAELDQARQRLSLCERWLAFGVELP